MNNNDYAPSQLTEALSKNKLFAKCLVTIQDDEGIYNVEGKEYEVLVDMESENCWVINCDNSLFEEIMIDKNNDEFELVIR